MKIENDSSCLALTEFFFGAISTETAHHDYGQHQKR